MEVVKTKAASELIGVHPKTLLKWVKHFQLPLIKNEVGHYLYRQIDITMLKSIKEQLDKGKLMTEVELPELPVKQVECSHKNEKETVDKKIETLIEKLKDLERMIHTKADEVLSTQVLNHRREIDQLSKRIEALEEKIEELANDHVKEPLSLAKEDHNEKPSLISWLRFPKRWRSKVQPKQEKAYN